MGIYLYPKPLEGETFDAFKARATQALQDLGSNTDPEWLECQIMEAWTDYLYEHAVSITLTMSREHNPNSIYNDPWGSCWRTTEIHSAVLPNITYSYVEKARAGSGDKFQVLKSAEDKQLVFGWANIAIDQNGEFPLDWDGDITAPTELENAAYGYVLKFREAGVQHEGEAVGHLVESVMFTKEKQEAMGIPAGIVPEGWWVGFHIPDKEVFAKAKTGELGMFSVQGNANRVPTGTSSDEGGDN